MSNLTLGQKVPEFSLQTTSNETYSLEKDLEERKGWHFIVFFRGAWCPVCIQDLKDIEESHSYFQGKNVSFTAISTDDLSNLRKLSDEHDFSFPILSDENLDVLRSYGVFYHDDTAPYEDHGSHGEAAYFLIDQSGNLLYQQKQTSPFGRPNATELRKIVQYIDKNLK
ncbi:peroxiredoxin family protein [Salipaludibacillus daqingensis]|uniref:peroxiredoxin family protein n=1 Tax=Salipaludibacillus daqingensis TaxID=3041001 RepID=UPI002474A38C|nr:peroxiredoxin family protein [Salipaludibacillus daqingensis]